MTMTSQQIDRLQHSFKELSSRSEEFGKLFFARLFTKQPMLRALLPRDEWQRTHDLLGGLGIVVKNLHKLDAISHTLMDFGARAQRSGIMPMHYGLAREALLDTMHDLLGPQWTEELDADWTEALNAVSSVLILGAGRARAKAA